MRLDALVPTTPRSLGIVRSLVFGFLAIQAACTSFVAVGCLPVTLMHPPGLMEYFSWKLYDRVVTPSGMLGLQVLLVAALLSAALGVATPVTTKIAAALYIFWQGILRSFGHFNHDEMVAVWCLIVLALTPCGHAFSIDSRFWPRPVLPAAAYGYPILLMRCILAWSYFTAGILKLRLGGWEYFQPDSFLTLAINNSLGNVHDTQFQLSLLLPEYRWIVTPALIGAVSWEIAFPLAVISRRLRPWFLASGVAFHVGTLLLMNITFPVQLAMYVVFVDWERIASRLFSTTPVRRSPGRSPAL